MNSRCVVCVLQQSSVTTGPSTTLVAAPALRRVAPPTSAKTCLVLRAASVPPATSEQVGSLLHLLATSDRLGSVLNLMATRDQVGSLLSLLATSDQVGSLLSLLVTSGYVGSLLTTSEQIHSLMSLLATSDQMGFSSVSSVYVRLNG